MTLTVRDVARLLAVTEKTIYRWIKQGVLPAYQINEQYRFNRAELLEWATSRKINVSAEIFAEPEGEAAGAMANAGGATDVGGKAGAGGAAGAGIGGVSEALVAGGVHYRVGGTDKATVLQAAVDMMKLPEEVDRNFLYQVLLAREALGSTGIGEGIAIPHVRNPIVLHLSRPTVTLCFLERPVDFGALDGQPVTTLFTLISPTVRAHLYLLSRLGFALRDARFKQAVLKQAPREEILEALREVERTMAATAARTSAGGGAGSTD